MYGATRKRKSSGGRDPSGSRQIAVGAQRLGSLLEKSIDKIRGIDDETNNTDTML